MNERSALFLIRPMLVDDIEQVQAIDALSFALPWPKNSYNFELKDNQHSRCWVVEDGSQEPKRIVAMAVTWLVVDELHVATIAVHPDWRGQGIGRRMMEVIMASARHENMLSATLEVRAGNITAQELYKKFGFVEVGRRRRYYKDNQEDALIMTVVLDQIKE